MTARRASDGTVVSTEFWSFSIDSCSIMGAMIVEGTLATRGPRLKDVRYEG